MKRTLPSISIILYTSKTLSNGEHPIMLRISHNGQRKYKSLGLSCSYKMWNENKEEVRSTHPNSKNINTIIRAERNKAEMKLMELERDNVDYSATSLIKSLTKSSSETITLFEIFEDRYSYFKDRGSMNSATGYRTLLNVIKRYSNNADFELFEINSQWIKDFEEHLRTKYKDTSIKKFFDCLKAIMNYAVEKGYIKSSPLNGYKHIRPLDTKTTKRALGIDEITNLMSYYLKTYHLNTDKKPNLEIVKKHYWNERFRRRGFTKVCKMDAEQLSLAMFICSYMFQGLALIDLANLKWGDINDIEIIDNEKYAIDCANHGIEYANEHKETKQYYEINVARSKTNKPVKIVVEVLIVYPFLLPFTEELKDIPSEQWDDKYVFPIYSEHDITAEKKFCRMVYATYLLNVNLKRIAERLGMRPITFYSARHTYASALYHANVPMGLIAQNMGRNPAEIETYLKDFDKESIIKANDHLFITSDDAFKNAQKEKDIIKSAERRTKWEEWENHREERDKTFIEKIEKGENKIAPISCY